MDVNPHSTSQIAKAIRGALPGLTYEQAALAAGAVHNLLMDIPAEDALAYARIVYNPDVHDHRLIQFVRDTREYIRGRGYHVKLHTVRTACEEVQKMP